MVTLSASHNEIEQGYVGVDLNRKSGAAKTCLEARVTLLVDFSPFKILLSGKNGNKSVKIPRLYEKILVKCISQTRCRLTLVLNFDHTVIQARMCCFA